MDLADLKLSIIIPTFNSGNNLEEALNSIVNQSYTNYEVWIIDNRSDEVTLNIIKKFASAHENIKWITEPDNGIYDAMNKGIKLAKGEWLYFMGSDDKLYDENVLLNIFQKTLPNRIKILYGNAQINGDAGWARNGQIYDGEFSLSKLIQRNICHQAIFYKKTIFEKCDGFTVKYSICADWDLNLRLWSKYSFHYIDKIIAIFKGGNSSYTVVNNYGDLEKWKNIAGYFKFKLADFEFTKFKQNFFVLSKYYFKEKNYLKSLFLLIIYYSHKMRF
jgi:glycosyltransferase involved in cell wall biosynthesis